MAWKRMSDRQSRSLLLIAGLIGLGNGPPALAQDGGAAPPPAAPASSDKRPTSREAEMEERIRQLEKMIRAMPDPERVRRLEERIKQMPDPQYVKELEAKVQQLSSQVKRVSTRLQGNQTTRPTAPAPTTAPDVTSLPAPLGFDESDLGVGEEPVGGAAGLSPSAPLPSSRFDMPEPIPDIPISSHFGPGFEFRTGDDEFNMQFHNLTQADGRFYGRGNQVPVSDTFAIAREWLVFSGHLTKPFEYYVSIADAVDTFNILDVFLNVNFDRRLQFRIGRFKTPFTYEFYAEPTQALANGEWSLFFNNFGMNRDGGAMVWGQALEDRLDYAVGLFNGVPNGFIDLSNPKSGIAYLNFAPYETQQDSVLENLNIGGSAVFGDQEHVPVPQTLRTIVPTSGNNVLGVPFLSFNNNVLARGQRDLWSLHMSYFYRSFWMIGEWQSGFQTYGLVNRTSSTRVPIESFYLQAGYLLTGERAASRGQVRPRSPFDLRRGRFGIGAWELAARFSLLDVGDQVFQAGLADPTLWTNQLYATDLAINWYWNQYIRVMLDWQHAGFGNPVVYRPDAFQTASDLFILRFQIWF
jgi:phosphate-selective porin OprO and OprP